MVQNVDFNLTTDDDEDVVSESGSGVTTEDIVTFPTFTEKETGSSSSRNDAIIIAVCVSVAVLSFIAIVILCSCYLRGKRKKRFARNSAKLQSVHLQLSSSRSRDLQQKTNTEELPPHRDQSEQHYRTPYRT
ncbi:uncharacterized protein LOC131928229 [Physella acuta]|uniref:uncharacterized protein LOC131928229 n=1 Tax=Physella acuta TaxID=109671 RepID=UPI0027DB0764|nr:uncharacterized protein LOC131928229 [Physella acuta]